MLYFKFIINQIYYTYFNILLRIKIKRFNKKLTKMKKKFRK